MKRTDTLLGLVVLALVLGGVFWARGWRSHAGPEGPALHPEGPALHPEGPALHPSVSPALKGRRSSSSSSSNARSPGPSGPGATADATVPDVTLTDGSVDLGDVRLTLSVTPRPPVAFQKKRFRVRVESTSARASADESSGTPLALEGGRISFEMVMPMGEHRYTLARGEGEWQEAEVVLPFCMSGDPRWYALVEGVVAGRPVIARFRLDLTKPSSAASP